MCEIVFTQKLDACQDISKNITISEQELLKCNVPKNPLGILMLIKNIFQNILEGLG